MAQKWALLLLVAAACVIFSRPASWASYWSVSSAQPSWTLQQTRAQVNLKDLFSAKDAFMNLHRHESRLSTGARQMRHTFPKHSNLEQPIATQSHFITVLYCGLLTACVATVAALLRLQRLSLRCGALAIASPMPLPASDGSIRQPWRLLAQSATAGAIVASEQEIRRKQISDQETLLMQPVQQQLPPPISAVQHPALAAETLRREGCVHLSGLLNKEECQEMLEELAPRLEMATARSALGGAQHRYDLKLPLQGMTYMAVQSAMGRGGLAKVLEIAAGPDAWLAELGALVSDPGAIRQPIHPDTVSRGGTEQPIYSTFIALQDITPAMGPTCMIPGTNNPEAHAELCGIEQESHQHLLSTRPNFDATLKCGDAIIFDSRTLHAGGANYLTEGRRRAIFYVSVQRAVEGEQFLPAAPERRTPPCAYSILRDYHNRFQLKDWQSWFAW